MSNLIRSFGYCGTTV